MLIKRVVEEAFLFLVSNLYLLIAFSDVLGWIKRKLVNLHILNLLILRGKTHEQTFSLWGCWEGKVILSCNLT
jgi:hypothetical protein